MNKFLNIFHQTEWIFVWQSCQTLLSCFGTSDCMACISSVFNFYLYFTDLESLTSNYAYSETPNCSEAAV